MTMTIDRGDVLTRERGILRLPRLADDEFRRFCRRSPMMRSPAE